MVKTAGQVLFSNNKKANQEQKRLCLDQKRCSVSEQSERGKGLGAEG